MSTEQESTRKPSIQRTLHRPSDEITDKPQLRVKPLARAEGPEAASQPTAAANATAAEQAVASAATIVMDPPEAEAPVETAGEAPLVEAVEESMVEEPEPPAESDADEPAMAESTRKVTRLPRIDLSRDPSLYATHRPAPADEAAEKAHLAAVTGQRPKERELSTGFLIGVGLIVLALIGGVSIVRLEKHVQRLEQRVSQLEHAPTQTAALNKGR
jgi:hypothetical protein